MSRRMMMVGLAALAMAMLVQAPVQAMTIGLTASAYTVERGGHTTVTVSAFNVPTLSSYQTVLSLPTGMSVPDLAAIHDGGFFTLGHQLDRNPAQPRLTSMISELPGVESRSSGVWARFDVNVDQTAALGTNAISTMEQETFGLDGGDTVVTPGLATVNITVAAPKLSATLLTLDFGKVTVNDSSALTSDITNSGVLATILNGRAQGLTVTQKPAGATGTPFTFASGATFDLKGNRSMKQSLSVNFAPTTVGVFQGYFTIVSDDGVGGPTASGASTTILLKGESIAETPEAPEPVTLTLLGLGSLALLRRR